MKKLNLASSSVCVCWQLLLFSALIAKTAFTEPSDVTDACYQKYKFDKSKCDVLPTSNNTDLANTPNSVSGLDLEEKQQRILDEGLAQLHFEKYNKTAIFVLGNTGSGKTTLTQILNGDLSKLHVVKAQEGKIVIIDDDNRIGLPTTTSKTLVPEYVVSPDTNTAFFDCPGFDDNRGAETDIAAMYFLSRITEHVNNNKFLFTVTHSSVTPGHDRLDFPLLVTHAARFLANISKFSQSIGLIVTKVVSFSESGDCLSDDEITKGIASFLEGFHSTLKAEQLNEEFNSEEKALYERKIQFVEAILHNPKNDRHSNIWFIRNPPKCGPFSEIPYILEVRNKITDLYHNLKYATSTPDDFGFTLKDKTVLQVKDIYARGVTAELEVSILLAVDEIFEEFESKFVEKLKSEYLMEDALLEIVDTMQRLEKFDPIQYENQTFPEATRALFETINIKIPGAHMVTVKYHERVLQFYERVTMSVIPRPSLEIHLSVLRNKVRTLKEKTWNYIEDDYVHKKYLQIEENVQFLVKWVEENGRNDFYNDLSRITLNQKVASLQNMTQQLKIMEIEGKSCVDSDAIVSNCTISRFIESLYKNMGKNAQLEQTVALKRFETRLDFIERLPGLKIKRHTTWFKIPIQFIETFGELNSFYGYVHQVDEDLKTYAKQISLNKLSSFVEWSYEEAVNLLQNHGFEPIMSIPFKNNASSYINEKDQMFLMKVVQNAFLATKISCLNQNEAAAMGNFVKMTDITTWQNVPCNFDTLTALDIYASEIFFLDENIAAVGKNLMIRVISDKWEVVRPAAIIDLSGKNGITLTNPTKLAGGNGNDGGPGEHGGNSGSFIGLYGAILNGEQLEINLNGGNGGSGENGENGQNGKTGRDADQNREGFPNPRGIQSNKYEKKGEQGSKGGDGGKGGARGLAGHSGAADFYPISPISHGAQEHDKIELSIKAGVDGSDGKGGMGGAGGRNGYSWECEKYEFKTESSMRGIDGGHGTSEWYWKQDCSEIRDKGVHPNGADGGSGQNYHGQDAPLKTPEPLTFPSKSVLSFKRWVLESGNEFGRQFVTKYNQNIGSSNETTYTFSKELLNLEETFFQNSIVPINFIFEYEDLHWRLRKYSFKTNQSDVLTNQNVLNLLNVLSYTKLISLREQERPSGMIINIAKYFEEIKNEINVLKSTHTAYKISSVRQKFQLNLDSKIQEAAKLISFDLQSRLKELDEKLEKQALQAMLEIAEVNNSTEELKQWMIEAHVNYERKLQDQNFLRGVDTFGTIVSSLSGLDPALDIFSKGADVIGVVARHNGYDEEPIKDHKEIPTAIQNALNGYHKNFMMTAKFSPFYNETLRKVLSEAEFQQLLSPLGRLKKAEENLTAISISLSNNQEIHFDWLVQIHERFESRASDLLNEIINLRAQSRSNSKNIQLDYLIESLSYVSKGIPNMLDFQDERCKLSPEISEMCDKSQIIKLRLQTIFQSFIPKFKTTMASLLKNMESMSDSSSALLVVKKLKTKELLQDTKLFLKMLVDKMEVQEETLLCIQQLDEAITSVITLYDYIQKYKETKELEDLIVGVNLASNFDITDNEELQRMATHITYYVQANQLLNEYELAMGAFKQWAFPLLRNYFTEDLFKLKDILKQVNNQSLEGTVSFIAQKITDLSDKLEKQKATTGKMDEMRIKSNFTSKSVSTKPFYVWKNDQWKHSIKRLLSGETVQLQASIWKSDWKKGAVKFKTIELFLNATDKDRQHELDENLKHFQLTMNHSGVSYYKILSDVFVLKSNSLTLKYSFENDASGSISKNLVVEKLNTVGDYLLSPYTHWAFQLNCITDNPECFGSLQQFTSFINLELHGEGMYIEETDENKNTLVELKVPENYAYALERK